ncbi:MAG: PaaI family thioesterase [Betaproteobacteria bacterium]
MDRQAFQDQIPDNCCYGCGPGNENGLRLKSYWDGDVSVSTFMPEHFHTAGPKHILNGGIIATIIDCHCICTAIADAYRRENRAIGTVPQIWCATASLKIDYLRPVALHQPVTLRAQIVEVGPKKTKVSCTLLSEGQECATGEVLAVRVPATWREK